MLEIMLIHNLAAYETFAILFRKFFFQPNFYRYDKIAIPLWCKTHSAELTFFYWSSEVELFFRPNALLAVLNRLKQKGEPIA